MNVLQFCATVDAAPSAPGAYILQVDLAEAVLVSITRQPPIGLLPGRYLYCGSANGPGGLRSRLARHMRHGKALHWHIDQLTARGTVAGTWIVRNARECDLVAMLAPLPMPIPRFGSSDCFRCLSHLLSLVPAALPVVSPAYIRQRSDASGRIIAERLKSRRSELVSESSDGPRVCPQCSRNTP